MYKDFKKSETLDTGFTSGNSLLWMFSGIVLGLVVGLGMYFLTNDKIPRISMIDTLEKKIQTVQTENPTGKQPEKKIVEKKIEEKQRKNKFSYYAVLPNLDVPVGSAKPIDTAHAVKTVHTNETSDQILTQQYEEAVKKQNELAEQDLEPVVEEAASLGDYLLQVASFKKQSMANKTKGRLSNKGIDAYVQKKKIKGRDWYRVVAGPVDQTSVDNWKKTVEQLGHKPLVISVR